MREPRLRLIGTDLRISGSAPQARPAPAHKWNGHPLADVEFLHMGTHRGDPPHQLMPGNMGRGDRRVVARPCVMIAAAHPGSFDVDDDARIGGSRGWYLMQLRANGELIEDDGTHTADRRARARWEPSVSA